VFIKVLRSKIHRATVTEADTHYVGSITIDAALCEEAGLVPGEAVLVADINNGARVETYVLFGEPNSGTICINGAAARRISVGDLVIIMGFAYLTPDEAKGLQPRIVLVDERNRMRQSP
jgi:aspartate 1-decarboxylase